MQSVVKSSMLNKPNIAARLAVRTTRPGLTPPSRVSPCVKRNIISKAAFDISDIKELPQQVLYGGAAAVGK